MDGRTDNIFSSRVNINLDILFWSVFTFCWSFLWLVNKHVLNFFFFLLLFVLCDMFSHCCHFSFEDVHNPNKCIHSFILCMRGADMNTLWQMSNWADKKQQQFSQQELTSRFYRDFSLSLSRLISNTKLWTLMSRQNSCGPTALQSPFSLVGGVSVWVEGHAGKKGNQWRVSTHLSNTPFHFLTS